MGIKSGTMEQYKGYSQFQSLKQFNNHVEMWLCECKKLFTKGELIGLKRLIRFAAKIPGVCHAKIGTLLKAIHETSNGKGISRSTFKRMLTKAKNIGLLTVFDTERKNGSQSSNLYVFQLFPGNEPPRAEKLNHPKTSNPSKTNKTKDLKKRTEGETPLDHTYIAEWVPEPFTRLAKCYWNEAKVIEAYWRMTRIAAYKNVCDGEEDETIVLCAALHSFKQLVRKMKQNKVHKPIAYYYGVVNKKLHDVYLSGPDAWGYELQRQKHGDEAEKLFAYMAQ